MDLPSDFGPLAKSKANCCPYVLDQRSVATDLKPGAVVDGRNNQIESAFPPRQTVRLVLFGFTKPDGYACCLDRSGEWWVVHPEALEAVS